MRLNELIKKLELTIKADAGNLEQEVDNCYVSDLLSNAMGQALPGSLWITMQGHPNIVAVASLLSLPAIIVAGNATVENDTLKKAVDNDVSILTSSMAVFELIGRLHTEGFTGKAK